MNPASRAWEDMMLGQGSDNSAGEKGSTRETERLSKSELTFTDLTKKGGHLRLYNLPLPSPSLLTSHHAPSQSPRPSTSMHAVTASGLDCPFSHPNRLGIPHVGERGQSISEAFRSHSSGIKPIRDTGAAAAAAAAAAARRRKQFSSKTGQRLIFQNDWKPAHAAALLQGVRCDYRRRRRSTVGHAIGRRRAGRLGVG